MNKAGPRTRINCDALCSINYEGDNFHGKIENVSLSGALIKMDDVVPDVFRPGATCNLTLFSEMPGNRTEYKCSIVRLESTLIGLKFLEINIPDYGV